MDGVVIQGILGLVQGLVGLANKFGLLTTGGSDFHGIDASETPLGGTDMPLEAAWRLIDLAKERGLTMVSSRPGN